jgi:adenosine deaminase
MAGPMPNQVRNDYLDQPDISRLVLAACVGSAGDSGAVLAEFRVGANASIQPGFVENFRAAASGTAGRHPGFTAVAVLSGLWPGRPGAMECIEACLELGPTAFGGVDFIPFPYEEDVAWSGTYSAAERLHAAGFGVTIHAGEFSEKHLAAAIELPGLSRIGHGTQLASRPALLRRAIDMGLVIECCVSSNALLGAVPSVDAHPLRRFVEEGARVVLATDDPARFSVSIEGEYALAARLGLDDRALAACTRTSIEASFAPSEDKQRLLELLDGAFNREPPRGPVP